MYYTDITGGQIDEATKTVILAINVGRYEDAVKVFELAIDAAKAFLSGSGIEASIADANCYLPKTVFNLGYYYYVAKDYESAAQTLAGALDAIKINICPIAYDGEKRSVVIKTAKLLSKIYSENLNDPVRAAQYMQEAACCYDDEALSTVVNYYRTGYGVPRSERVAQIWETVLGYNEFSRKYQWDNYFKLENHKLVGINPQGGKMSQDVIIPYGVTIIVKMPGLKNVIVPPTVKTVRSGAGLSVPNEVVVFTGPLDQIEDKAFNLNMILEEVYLPPAVCSIGNSAFEACRRLTRVEMPSIHLGKLGICAFGGCVSLEEINLDASKIDYVDGSAFLKDEARIKIKGTAKDTAGWSEYWNLYAPGDYHRIEYVK